MAVLNSARASVARAATTDKAPTKRIVKVTVGSPKKGKKLKKPKKIY